MCACACVRACTCTYGRSWGNLIQLVLSSHHGSVSHLDGLITYFFRITATSIAVTPRGWRDDSGLRAHAIAEIQGSVPSTFMVTHIYLAFSRIPTADSICGENSCLQHEQHLTSIRMTHLVRAACSPWRFRKTCEHL